MSTYETTEWLEEEKQPRGRPAVAWLALLAGAGLALFGTTRK